ncbi:MAG: hypothetical protein IH950_03675 [Bacteroidetes bacterium]|nr:hypothetical protein [Bacteroidota bacterium]
MAINDFSEKEIRKAILNKVNPAKINKNAPHWKGYIYLDNKLITKVKIPNEHKTIMKESKSKYIAVALRLEDEQFNQLIDCSMKGSAYYKLQKLIEA